MYLSIHIRNIKNPHFMVKGIHSNEKDHDPGGGTLDIHIHQSGLHPGFSHDGLHLGGDVVQAVVVMG